MIMLVRGCDERGSGRFEERKHAIGFEIAWMLWEGRYSTTASYPPIAAMTSLTAQLNGIISA